MIGAADHSGGHNAAEMFRAATLAYRRERWERVPILWRASAAFYQWGGVEAAVTMAFLRRMLDVTLAGGYECPRCGAVSHHPEDARRRYCGRCHRFEEDA